VVESALQEEVEAEVAVAEVAVPVAIRTEVMERVVVPEDAVVLVALVELVVVGHSQSMLHQVMQPRLLGRW
jgi:hypothetical protein